MTAEQLIKHYKMMRHPEGGAFVETYRCGQQEAFQGFPGPRSISTAIYFLLEETDFSAFHRIKSDELWHFYLGGPLKIVEITPDGKLIETLLGPQNLQYMVRAGHWFASIPLQGSQFSFVGCTVAPGFDFQDFELAKRAGLIDQFPHLRDLITQLTRS